MLTDASKETKSAEVSDEKLDESLEKITEDEDVSDEKTDSIEEK